MNQNFQCRQVSLVIQQSREGFTITIKGGNLSSEEPSYPYRELKEKVAACKNLRELYYLLFATDDDSKEVLDIFTKRRLEIDGILPLEEGPMAA